MKSNTSKTTTNTTSKTNVRFKHIPVQLFFKHRIAWLAVLLIASLPFGLTACVGTSRVITGKPLPPTEPSAIKIYSKPPAAFKEIAIIESAKADFIFNPELHNSANNKQDIIAGMKAEAARLGANGILIRSLDHKSGVIGAGYGLSSSGTNRASNNAAAENSQSADNNTLHGVAIYVLEDDTN